MGGEHPPSAKTFIAGVGSSPHGRGTFVFRFANSPLARVIPAWAGNMLILPKPARRWTGHPRMGGEHVDGLPAGTPAHGSSPHGRGTSGHAGGNLLAERVIPAWAGNIHGAYRGGFNGAGHPRMGGEHTKGSRRVAAMRGSSPHGRGTSAPSGRREKPARVIPAWAGNMMLESTSRAISAGHPRMGGEHSGPKPSLVFARGSSPHGRGTSDRGRVVLLLVRVIPAWAGNMGRRRRHSRSAAGHPRMGGEHVVCNCDLISEGGSSPHGRGTSGHPVPGVRRRRVIPAWAGNMACPPSPSPPPPGHPRMGGEHGNPRAGPALHFGSSPHGRGTWRAVASSAGDRRVIPAWAGNIWCNGAAARAASGHPRMGGEHFLADRTGQDDRGSSPHGRGTYLLQPYDYNMIFTM